MPLALLGALVLAFGLLIPWLGYYHDEWHFIYYDAIRGPQGLVEMFKYDGHPLAVWTYLLSFNLLGVRPLGWHIYSLLWRWLAVTMFWLLLNRLWTSQKRLTFIAALLFAVYPTFVLQVLPISYFEVWVGFFLIFLSFFCTLQAVRHPEKFWLYTALAILAKFGQMLTSEYTWGMELMRPVMIWFLLPGKLTFRDKILQSIKIWLPYLAIFAGFSLWRTLFFQAGRKEIAFQSEIFQAPLQTAFGWIQHGFPDLVLILLTSWYEVLQPANLFLGSRENLLLLGLMIISSGALFFYLQGLTQADETEASRQPVLRAAVILGLTGLVVGLIPSYAAGYTVYLSAPPGNTRFALGALPAAAILISAALELLISSNRARMGVVAVLVSLAIGWHVRYTSEFRDLWRYQVDFYRQLSWRAPALKPGTALMATGPFFPRTQYPSAILAVSGNYPTALAINTMYAGKPGVDGKIPYWFFQAADESPGASGPENDRHLNSRFSGVAGQNLYFSYRPQRGQCLRILSPADTPAPDTDAQGPISPEYSLSGIDPAGQTDFSLLNQLIGPEKARNWCYYYEKADLARQRADWPAIAALWQTAQARRFKPSEGQEYIPFITAFAQLGRWDEALELTRSANKITARGADTYCRLWTRLAAETPSAPPKAAAVAKIREIFSCPIPEQP
jgi:hypothetical protein